MILLPMTLAQRAKGQWSSRKSFSMRSQHPLYAHR